MWSYFWPGKAPDRSTSAILKYDQQRERNTAVPTGHQQRELYSLTPTLLSTHTHTHTHTVSHTHTHPSTHTHTHTHTHTLPPSSTGDSLPLAGDDVIIP